MNPTLDKPGGKEMQSCQTAASLYSHISSPSPLTLLQSGSSDLGCWEWGIGVVSASGEGACFHTPPFPPNPQPGFSGQNGAREALQGIIDPPRKGWGSLSLLCSGLPC